MSIDLRKQKKRLADTIKNAGPRYTSAFNVEVSIASVFDGLGRTFNFYNDLKNRIEKFITAFQSSDAQKVKTLIGEASFENLLNESKELLKIIGKIPNSGGKVTLPFGEIEKQAKSVRTQITKAFDIIREKRKEEEQKNPPKENQSYHFDSELFKSERDYLNRLVNEVGDLMYFARGRNAIAANRKLLVLRGEAGSGKTHFLCDLAKSRIEQKLPTLIFLGQEFNDRDPWKTIFSKIGWTGTKKEFLETLENNASNKSTRAFIIVDAINEQKKNVLWSSLVNDTKDYKSICVILSVRTGFEFSVLPKAVRKIALDVIHEGFADREWDALTGFFQFYNLEPDLPLLFPDFTNPLFLKIFCETYRDEGTTVHLRGHEGFTKVFEHYVIKQGKKSLQDMSSTNLDVQNLVWRKTIKKIADYMVTNKTDRIPQVDAELITDQVFTGRGAEFLDALEKNWLLLKNPIYSNTAPYGVVGFEYAFPYQKFSDHLIVRHLLADSATISDPKNLFGPTGKLNYVFSDWKFNGLVYALAIQIPERFNGVELIMIANSSFKKTILARDSFLQSLIWRDNAIKNNKLKFFKQATILNIINKIILKQSNGFEEVMETMLTVAPIPKHPLNAYLLSSYLRNFKIAKRDSVWIPFLDHKYNNSSAVDRLIHWAIKISHQTSYDEESIKLVGITLSWFLSSSNRYLRDTSTKALVSLLKDRIAILIDILKFFEKSDDPYIQERLLAVSYGCSMVSRDPKLYDLGLYVYKKIFSNNKPPVHILIRDYARGCVEAVGRIYPALNSKIDKKKILPPYGSKYPDKFPTIDHLTKKYKEAKTVDNGRSPYGTIWYSLMYNNGGGIADFGNYILNSTVGNWGKKKLYKNGKAPKSDKQIADEFIDNLNSAQSKLWEEYQEIKRAGYRISFSISFLGSNKRIGPKVDKKEVAESTKRIAVAKKAFEKSLFAHDQGAYKKASKYFDNDRKFKADDIDTAPIQRWVFQKVIQLGWTPELFYQFDSGNNERGRSANKAERIGKKYQWIGFHEILARIADNFVFKGGWGQHYSTYQGAWSLYRRDIDPSHSINLTRDAHKVNTWWINKKYDNWQKSISAKKWIANDDALDLMDKFFSMKDPDGKEWLCLDGYFKWREPKKPGKEDSFSTEEREVWVMNQAYIIKESESKSLYNWAKSKKISWGWFPDPVDMTHVHLGEFPKSSAYSDQYDYKKNPWQSVRGDESEGSNFQVITASEKYMNESSSFDCSVRDTVHVFLPTKILIEDLGLKTNHIAGEFVDDTEALIAQDPSIQNGGQNCLLFRKDAMLKFLKKNNYCLVWTVLGEKIVMGASGSYGILDMGATYVMDKDGNIKGRKYKEMRGANNRAPKKKK